MKTIKLNKAKAKTEIIIKPDADDDYLIYIITFNLSTTMEKSRKLITKRDYDHFLKCYLENGWSIKNPNNPMVKKDKKIKNI
jgi:hypothetical protein